MKSPTLKPFDDHVGAADVSLIGWSYLGAVVALYASCFPMRVRHVALLCPMASHPGPFPGMQPYREMIDSREADLAERLAQLRQRADQEPSPANWRAFQLTRATVRMGDPRAADRVVADPWQHRQEWAPTVEPTLEALFGSLDR